MPIDQRSPGGSANPLSKRLRRYFVTGLATLLPVIVTLYLLLVIFQFVDGLLGRYINAFWLRTYGYEIPGLGLVMTVLLILLVGFISSYFLGQRMLDGLEGWFSRLPVIRRIYPSVKQLASFLLSKDEDQQPGFRRVVLVQYPRLGCYSIAFVTNESPFAPEYLKTPTVTLLIPTPPSPLTGPIIVVPKGEIVDLDMTIEDAIKFVVSGGIVASAVHAKPAGAA